LKTQELIDFIRELGVEPPKRIRCGSELYADIMTEAMLAASRAPWHPYVEPLTEIHPRTLMFLGAEVVLQTQMQPCAFEFDR